MRSSALVLLACSPSAMLAQSSIFDPSHLPARAETAVALGTLLEQDSDLATTIALAAAAGTRLPVGSAARHRLDAALRSANTAVDGGRPVPSLRLALDDLVETLTFVPRQQAELPAGFPGFGAVDEIELRHYPAYRMVRTTLQGGSSSAFLPLFRHIEANDIAMTTPVQMDWQADTERAAERPTRMAFLYGDPSTIPRTTDGGVEVVDAPATTVLSIGAIGDDRRDRVERLRSRLETFLTTTNGAWVASGPLRTMGYNSPMVPRDRRYFEVQLTVRSVEAVIR
ncbi:MAG: heme-binding protein [Planctomycetota bacterium]